MSFLRRVSAGFWSYVSPTKPETKNAPGPKHESGLVRQGLPVRESSIKDVVEHSRSMSPEERIDSWRVGSPSDASSSTTVVRKREAPDESSKRGPGRPRNPLKTSEIKMEDRTGRKRQWKARKSTPMEDVDMDYTPEVQSDSDVDMEDEVEEMARADADSDDASNIHVGKSSTPSQSIRTGAYPYDETELDSSLVVSEAEYRNETPRRKVLVSPTEEHFSRGVSTEELRAQGWDDDHIVLVQHIAMRGFEPLMPQYWKFDYRFHMPDSLFATDDASTDAVISSVRGNHYRAMIALEKLFELGGRVRDRVYLKGRVRPDQQVRRTLQEYMKWALDDSGLDETTTVPLVTIESKPRHIDAEVLKQNAKCKLARLAARYKEAFRVSQSIESSPKSNASTQLAYPVPTLYAIIASHTLVALTAYNPQEAEPDVKIVAMFEMKDKNYDVWNALALATVVCHTRNVQLRIAEETGLGSSKTGSGGWRRAAETDEDDPDA